MTARPGRISRCWSSFTSPATSALMSSAIFVPSIKVAVMYLPQIPHSSYTVSGMVVILLALVILAETPFGSSVDRALISAHSSDWNEAMAALDQAWAEDSAAFETNNLYYLRGRIAEQQQNWNRALEEFGR